MRSSGAVITVVHTAITTSMVKTFGGMMPRLRPRFSTINSMSARVFISTPSVEALAGFTPAARAASVTGTILASTATATIRRHQAQSVSVVSPRMLVRRPV